MRVHLGVLFALAATCPNSTCWQGMSGPYEVPAIGTSAPVVSGGVPVVTEFCHGWSDGYLEGWQSVRGPGSTHPVPLCPSAVCGGDTYDDGYNRGFSSGVESATRSG
jgi:hypothetical protein